MMRVVVVCGVPPRRCTAIRRESDSAFASRIQLCCCRVPFSHRFDFFFVLLRNNKSVEIIFCAVALRRKIYIIFFLTSRKIPRLMLWNGNKVCFFRRACHSMPLRCRGCKVCFWFQTEIDFIELLIVRFRCLRSIELECVPSMTT